MVIRYFFESDSKAFYRTDMHGELTHRVSDPNWEPPPAYEPNPKYDPNIEGSEPFIEVPYSGDIPTISEPNPECLIPSAAKEISEDTYLQMLNGESEDEQIDVDGEGLPTLAPVPLDEAYERIIKRVNSDCSGAITGGFNSNALGSTHRYSSDLEDQLNISGNIQLGIDTLHICYNAEGVREFRSHTAAQMRQVGVDFAAHKLACLQQAGQLKNAAKMALDAGDRTALEAVQWPNGF